MTSSAPDRHRFDGSDDQDVADSVVTVEVINSIHVDAQDVLPQVLGLDHRAPDHESIGSDRDPYFGAPRARTNGRCEMPHQENWTGYDVIGDVHGHADALTELLAAMDYVESDGVWAHQDRQAIFVGDLIDRGPKQIDSVRIARAMVEGGSAQIVLGNHEFNSVAYATADGRGDYLRPHNEKNNEQHKQFLEAVGFGSTAHREMIEWFMTIPLWLDLGGLRVVHACWSSKHIDYLQRLVGENDTLTEELGVAASTKGSQSYDAIETILKGPEVSLGDVHYHDKDNNFRDQARIAWWKESATSLSTAALIPSGTDIRDPSCMPTSLPDRRLAEHERFCYESEVPVIFGHYWWSAAHGIGSDRAVCVDYSVAKEGELVAYRWDGETVLSDSKIVRAADLG